MKVAPSKTAFLTVTRELLETPGFRLPDGFVVNAQDKPSDDGVVALMVSGPFPDELPALAAQVSAVVGERRDRDDRILFWQWTHNGEHVGAPVPMYGGKIIKPFDAADRPIENWP